MSSSLKHGGQSEIALTVNGERKTVLAFPMERLLDVLRQQLGLTGAKEGCGEGECGSCSVLMDGTLVNSCLVPVLQAEGARHRYHRRTRVGYSTANAAGGFSGMRRGTVRHLHSGNDSCRIASFEQDALSPRWKR